ncbi:4'-phosphopantetheinyl transferase superfamily protein [Maribacter litopenaei]|uniref:4'-phosphopantetheinyl transferase superfamily protein n=1 Tax=Maribacter litopenaei TaxID=2976127 RepID=A0ABY5YB63_9FLAO|nr:4'-phosphopantetheinyl transferase superfamily protein [Maribacter litopenaei]UWX56076.1 4'-phosphopantetheinyl transferase superfamily protein [Maribacter litopenaei]
MISSNKTLTFYKFSTRKEAILKAIGKGINVDLKSITVTDGEHLVPTNILSQKSQFVILSFEVDEHHVGAMAFEGVYDNSAEHMPFSQLPRL